MEKYIGTVLNDRYMITEVVGVGGMAYVFKAFDKICNRVVAVKILKDEFMSDAQFRRRFTNESKAITMLSHNNIVDVYDVSLEGDTLYIVMEYIDGITLKEYMEKKGILSDVEALHFIKQILKGLAHAHERGIVHRDIKPHNIILLKDGTIKITDFGIARLTKFDTQTISDMTIGSVHYISPEQASGDRTDERSDIYSAGIILYEMLTGKLPFEADTAVAVALMQVQAQPELPSEINDQLKQGLEEINLKAIMKDPAVRYQSAGAFLADIALYEADPTIIFNYLSETESEEEIPAYQTDNSPTIFAADLLGQDVKKDAAVQEPSDSAKEEENEEEPTSTFKSTWLPIIGGIGAAIVVLVITALCIIFQKEIGDLFGSKKIDCPNLLGMTIEDAKELDDVIDYDLKIKKIKEETNDATAGTIISQSPLNSSKIKEGGTIEVTVSKGPGSGNQTDQNIPSGSNYVPDIVGYTLKDAVKKFEEQGIKYQIKYDTSDEVEKGKVVSTSPRAGVEIYDTTVVQIVISEGKEVETVEMPNLVGLTLENAEMTLERFGLVLGKKTTESSDEYEKGVVISQEIKKGDEIEVGTKVNIVVSGGKEEEPKKIAVPNLAGMTKEEAESALTKAGLKLGSVTEEASDSVEAGKVIFQGTAKDTEVEEGTAVNITVSTGPAA